MAIRSFKEIVDNKGYRISSKDRKIFERGDLQSFFGLSESDVIEFIVYDANDNLLPQTDGTGVRYIPLTTQNISDYFLIAEGTLFQSLSFPSEYFIDVERLLRESGYNNGIFKTQITLLNKRVGSNVAGEQLWISEISPSRTEVRLLPLNTDENSKTELYERYNTMVNGSDFKEDTLPYISLFLDKITPQSISDFIKSKYSENWYNKLRNEFNIANFDQFTTTVYNKFVEAVGYEYTNRVSKVGDLNYGKQLPPNERISLSKDEIKNTCIRILAQCIDFYLYQRNTINQTTSDRALDESKDPIQYIIQQRTSDTLITTPTPTTPVIRVNKNIQTGVGTANQQQQMQTLSALGGISPVSINNVSSGTVIMQGSNTTSTSTTGSNTNTGGGGNSGGGGGNGGGNGGFSLIGTL